MQFFYQFSKFSKYLSLFCRSETLPEEIEVDKMYELNKAVKVDMQ